MDITDRDLATVIYPVHNDSYPVKTVELSISSVNLESSYTNYPNPFNPMVDGYTTIGFNLSEAASIDIEIFTITGEIVSEIALNSDRLSGPHQSDTWNGTNDVGFKVISGTYLCRITARYDSGRTEEFIRKIAVIR
jgi:flagellar hook assembly protein FlgD